MTVKKGCGSCEKRRAREKNKSADLLVKGIEADMTFEESVAYAGLDGNNLTAAYELLESFTTPEHLEQLNAKIEWR